MAYPRGANRGRSFGAPGQIEEWRPSAEVLDGGRAVASLTVPGGQEFHFPHFFLKFRSIFPQTFLIFFLILALRVGKSPTREGPGYATGWGKGARCSK